MPDTIAQEFRRLKIDFEAQASRYPDQTLRVYTVDLDNPPVPGQDVFRQPNHAVNLWQFMGSADLDADVDRLVEAKITPFGLTGAYFSTFGVLEGSETGLFRRMAYRAGTLVPSEIQIDVPTRLVSEWRAVGAASKPMIACNRDPLAIWINLLLICVTTYQPERYRGSTLLVDPFVASIPACDFVLNHMPPTQSSPAVSLANRRFSVALSFPGEKRHFVSQVAERLRVFGIDVFYDAYYEAELAQPDLDLLLQSIYRHQSDLVVVFLCEEYDRKEWCGLEWRAIRDLIKNRRSSSIMPMRFDATEIPGLFSIDGYFDLANRTPEHAAVAIFTRVQASLPQGG